jgi:hypothetical protein
MIMIIMIMMILIIIIMIIIMIMIIIIIIIIIVMITKRGLLMYLHTTASPCGMSEVDRTSAMPLPLDDDAGLAIQVVLT